MIGKSRTTVGLLTRVAAAALVGAVTAAGPNAASAQGASDLDCKRCVDTKDLDKRAVSRSRIKKSAVTFGKLQDTVENAIKQDRTFYVTLDSDGAEATLVTQGALRMFARCILNDAGFNRIHIVMTSTVAGWFVDEVSGPRAAGEEVIVENQSVPIGTSTFRDRDGDGAIAPDGSVIGPFPIFALGFNVFGHFCVVSGRTSAITGQL